MVLSVYFDDWLIHWCDTGIVMIRERGHRLWMVEVYKLHSN